MFSAINKAARPRSRTSTRPPRRAAPAPPTSGGGERGECCVCFEEIPEAEYRYFPCSHWTCDACFQRVDHCPTCRIGKDGRTQQERQASDEEQALGNAQLFARRLVAATSRVVFFQGGDAGPMAPENMSVTTAGLNGAIAQALENEFGRSLTADANGVRSMVVSRDHVPPWLHAVLDRVVRETHPGAVLEVEAVHVRHARQGRDRGRGRARTEGVP